VPDWAILHRLMKDDADLGLVGVEKFSSNLCKELLHGNQIVRQFKYNVLVIDRCNSLLDTRSIVEVAKASRTETFFCGS
jgi:hypothetical protein